VLRLPLPDSTWSIGYANDTIVLASGENFAEAVYHANYAAILVVKEIERLGLEISAGKTQATCFPLDAIPGLGVHLFLKDKMIEISRVIKYVGVYLDGDLKN